MIEELNVNRQSPSIKLELHSIKYDIDEMYLNIFLFLYIYMYYISYVFVPLNMLINAFSLFSIYSLNSSNDEYIS